MSNRSLRRYFCRSAYRGILLATIAGCGREISNESAGVVLSSDEQPRVRSQQSSSMERSYNERATDPEDQIDLQSIHATTDEFGRAATIERERALVRLMVTTPTPEINIPMSMTLSEVLSKFSGAMSQHTNIPVRFGLDQTDPDIGEDPAYLDNTSVGPLTITAGSMQVSSALAEVLSAVKDQELTWMIRNESIVITTIETTELSENLILRSYDIGPMLRTGVSAKSIRSTILNLSTTTVPWLEHGDEFGALEVVGDHLIVQQTRSGHQQVFELVERLKQGLESFEAHRVKSRIGQ
ncbi:MAG: hypothetical protein ACK58L_09280 [Planctomycetota bacterium]